MVQGDDEWHLWRRQGVCASDAPAIMGASPYKKALDIYNEKLGLVPKTIPNEAMLRGSRLEPRARAIFEFMMEKDFPADLAVMDGFPYLRASLDGKSSDNELCEFKYIGKKKDGIRQDYLIQIQFQLMVTGIFVNWYVPYNCDATSERVFLHEPVKIIADNSMQEAIFKKCTLFWECVKNKIPPKY